MNKFLIMVISMGCIFGAVNSKAETLSCARYDFQSDTLHQGPDMSVVVVDTVDAHCSDGHFVKISGIGLGLRWSNISGFFLNCFGSDDVRGKYYGLKADAAIVFGADVAVYASKKGLCVLGGGSAASVGLAASGSQLVIK